MGADLSLHGGSVQIAKYILRTRNDRNLLRAGPEGYSRRVLN